ncbi:hypothetical protein Zmor_024363 [Zophobas morio]|uniref:Uncharacterized protein n=1 Tax=Zophobas morio TaxID=2755281 RepID=A0AA38M7Z6_9CUCU|nr:hypothetical protein Zmor_024363 [Zophobas morio]
MQASRDDPSSANLVLLMHELIILIENDQVDDFKRLSAETIHMWNTTNTKSGLKLILEAIKSNRKEIFDFLLHDCYSYCSEDLIAPDDSGKTALHVACDQKNDNTFSNSSGHVDEEHITTLLSYATDLLDIFDRTVNFGLPNFIQDVVFFHKFDEHSPHVMQFNVLLKLAEQNSFLFHKAFEYEFEFCTAMTYGPQDEKRNFGELLLSLLGLKNDYLEILLEKCAPEICQVFEKCVFHYNTRFLRFSSSCCGCGKHTFRSYLELPEEYQCEKIFSINSTLEKLILLIGKNETVSQSVIRFVEILDGEYFFRCMVETNNESTTTEIFIYLLMYGLRVKANLFDVVYSAYGYCELFKYGHRRSTTRKLTK